MEFYWDSRRHKAGKLRCAINVQWSDTLLYGKLISLTSLWTLCTFQLRCRYIFFFFFKLFVSFLIFFFSSFNLFTNGIEGKKKNWVHKAVIKKKKNKQKIMHKSQSGRTLFYNFFFLIKLSTYVKLDELGLMQMGFLWM